MGGTWRLGFLVPASAVTGTHLSGSQLDGNALCGVGGFRDGPGFQVSMGVDACALQWPGYQTARAPVILPRLLLVRVDNSHHPRRRVQPHA